MKATNKTKDLSIEFSETNRKKIDYFFKKELRQIF